MLHHQTGAYGRTVTTVEPVNELDHDDGVWMAFQSTFLDADRHTQPDLMNVSMNLGFLNKNALYDLGT